jgi:hypothetical protein
MLRHYQENKELVMTLNYKGVFVIAIYASANGEKIFFQD